MPIRKYQKLKSSTWLVLNGLMSDAFCGRRRQRLEDLRPVDLEEQVEHDDDEDHVDEEPLDEVRDDDRDLAAREDEEERECRAARS